MRPIVQICGVAAMIGGVLRIVDGFVTQLYSLATLAILYLLTDIFLLLGIAGIYWSRRETLGAAGTIGAAIFAIGIVLVRVSAVGALGADGYQLAAAVALIGLAILSAETLLRRDGRYLSAALWLLSLPLAVAGIIGIAPAAMMVLAGVAFGAGFVAAGAEVLAV